jgi:hypothetical protein
MKIVYRKDIKPKLWNDFVSKNSFTSVFSEYDFVETFKNYSNYKDCSLVVLDVKSNLILAMSTSFMVNIENTFFKELVSLPYSYGTFCGEEKYLKNILNYIDHNIINQYVVRHRIVLNTNNSYYLNFLHKNKFYLSVNTVDFSISLDQSYDDFLGKISSGNRNDIKRAYKKNALVIKSLKLTSENLSSFYRLYKSTMQRNSVKNFYEIEYFKNLYETVNVIYIAAFYEDNLIGGRFHIIDNNKKEVYYMWGAYDSKYFRLLPNAALYDFCFKFFKDLGYKNYKLGGTMLNINNNKLLKHKLQWTEKVEPIFLLEKKYLSLLAMLFNTVKYARGIFR